MNVIIDVGVQRSRLAFAQSIDSADHYNRQNKLQHAEKTLTMAN